MSVAAAGAAIGAPAGLHAAHWAELEAQGFTVVRGFAGPRTTRRARALIDAMLGPPAECVDGHIRSAGGAVNVGVARQAEGAVRRVPGGARPPRIDSAGHRHTLRHPLRDPLMAEVIPALLTVHRQLLCAGDGLRLHQPWTLKSF
jgi:hypothetical protein